MLRDLAVWLLYSPRRLPVLAVPVVAIALVASAVLSESDQSSSGPMPTIADPSSSAAAPDSSSPAEADSEEAASPRAIRNAARRFLGEYAVLRGSEPKAVPRSLRRLSTPALWRGLQLTRPDSLPTGSVTQVLVEDIGPFSGTATAKLDSGKELLISVVAWEHGWRVSDIRLTGAP